MISDSEDGDSIHPNSHVSGSEVGNLAASLKLKTKMETMQSNKNVANVNTPGFDFKKDETDADSNDSSFIAKQK